MKIKQQSYIYRTCPFKLYKQAWYVSDKGPKTTSYDITDF